MTIKTSRKLSRRGMMKRAAAVGSLAISGTVVSSRTGRAAPEAKMESIDVISKQSNYYHGWPTVARRKNGQLRLVWSGGREGHICPFGRVESMVSYDDGRTWTWPRVLLDSALDDRDSGIIETARGTLLVTIFTSLAYVQYALAPAQKRLAETGDSGWPKGKLDRWLAAHRRLAPEQRTAQLGSWMIRSVDGGISWSRPYRSCVNSPHGPTQLKDGRLLYAGKNIGHPANERSFVGVCQSTDDGASWERLAEIPARQGDSPNDYHELHAVETDSGRIVVHIRNHNRQNAGETLQSESTDGGKTWSTPHAIGVWGLPSHLCRLHDGRLLMSYGYRRRPYGNQARISEDEGKSWSEPITISDDGATGDLGYPSTVQLADQSLLTIWYENQSSSPMAVLRQARWRLT